MKIKLNLGLDIEFPILVGQLFKTKSKLTLRDKINGQLALSVCNKGLCLC